MSSQNQLKSLVFIPLPIISHLVPSVEMAKLLAERDERLSITFLIMKFPTDTKIDGIVNSTSHSSRIKFIQLPQNDEIILEPIPTFLHRSVESNKVNIRTEVAKLMEASERIEVAGLILDVLCCSVIDVANDFQIPTYVWSIFGAATLGPMFHIQSLRDDHNQDVLENADLDSVLSIPTYAQQVPIRVLPCPIFDRERHFLDYAKRFRETKGIIINTFVELEPHAIRVLMGDEKIPPVYPVGPILQIPDKENYKNKVKENEIIGWLDTQPNSSVVYICFGSFGFIQDDQVKEIALALEQSGYRFLWSLRKPPPKQKLDFPGEHENPVQVLPKGFLERMERIGKVIGWAPQLAILSHPATGGFVSHCGWNSILESVWCGVPIATWPVAAEQQMNSFQLVKELGIAVEIQMDYKITSNVIVKSEKIIQAIQELMDPGNEIRSKMNLLKRESRKALVEGGSSYDCLDCLLDNVIKS